MEDAQMKGQDDPRGSGKSESNRGDHIFPDDCFTNGGEVVSVVSQLPITPGTPGTPESIPGPYHNWLD